MTYLVLAFSVLAIIAAVAIYREYGYWKKYGVRTTAEIIEVEEYGGNLEMTDIHKKHMAVFSYNVNGIQLESKPMMINYAAMPGEKKEIFYSSECISKVCVSSNKENLLFFSIGCAAFSIIMFVCFFAMRGV